MPSTRRHFLKRSGLVAATAIAAPHIVGSSNAQARPGRKPRKIIMLVSDGMSMGTWTGADYLSMLTRQRPTTWMQLLQRPEAVSGLMNMRSLNSLVTDSSAASSAWGSGSLIINGMVNQTPDGEDLKTLYEVLRDAGWQRGLVTTTEMSHATPAGFAASVLNRGMGEVIAEQYLERRVDVLLGGGRNHFDPARRRDKRDLRGDFAEAGYAILDTAEELRAASPDKRWLGLFDTGHLPWMVDYRHNAEAMRSIPRLPEMARLALSKLENAERFILQVEGGRVDQAAHNCDYAAALHDQIEFDEAIDVCLEFQTRHPETLVVITTDHGTGNPGVNAAGAQYARSSALFRNVMEMKCSFPEILRQLGREPEVDHIRQVLQETTGFRPSEEKAEMLAPFLARKGRALYDAMNNPVAQLGQLLGNHLATGWTGTVHTADFVPVTALGPGAERFRGLIQSTDVFHNFMAFAGIDFRNPSLPLTDGFGPDETAMENTGEYWQAA